MVIRYYRRWGKFVCDAHIPALMYEYVMGTNECVWMVPGTFDWEGNPTW